ncbi:TetR/AcrR family transcriptional regulator [Pseudomonas poae]|nr:TetR/AcrR family transcriptional regulator [Pseudomonas poae]
MAGLREQQKENRRLAICSSAIKLFASRGYAGTTVGAIASDAKVSPATVFNYFKTKKDIILGVIDAADQQAFIQIGNKKSQWKDAVAALVEVDRLITIYECKVLPVSVWREVLPAWSVAPPIQLVTLNQKIIELIIEVLISLREKNLINQKADLLFVATFLNSYANSRFRWEIQSGDFCIDSHVMHMNDAITMLIYGIRQ